MVFSFANQWAPAHSSREILYGQSFTYFLLILQLEGHNEMFNHCMI